MSGTSRTESAKRVQGTKQTERRAIALIADRVAQMGHLWNETQNDYGIDGSIELVDPGSNKATNRVVLVQSKGTSIPFGERVTYTPRESDLRYWLNGNAPVALVRSHPASGEAFWVSVKDYFAEHPEDRASRRIVFDRDADRFDESAADALWQLGRPQRGGLHLGPPPLDELLTANLLPVLRYPGQIFCAPTRAGTNKLARMRFTDMQGTWPRAWTVWQGQVYSFHDPAESAVARLCDGPWTSFATADWADADDEDQRRRFVQLLNGALSFQMQSAMRGGGDLMWMRATRDLEPLELPGARGMTRTVVSVYRREDDSVKYVRHLAMERRFHRYADEWFLEITPTYHFTIDGRTEDRFAADKLARIKRTERFGDFRRHVETLSWVLTGSVDLGGLSPDPDDELLEFGPLVEVALEGSIRNDDEDDS